MTTIHHPSCPARVYDNPGATASPWPGTCLCGPEAVAEDKLILMERSPDGMLLDIITHASQAYVDFMDNAHGRGRPKGLLSCILLDAELDAPVSVSLGVQA